MNTSAMELLKIDRRFFEVAQDSSGRWFKAMKALNGRRSFYVSLDTDNAVLAQLFQLYEERSKHPMDAKRVRIIYGDVASGRPWGDIVIGYIGKSTGEIPVPLIIYNSRSSGGAAILTESILAITNTLRDQTTTGYYFTHWAHARWKSSSDPAYTEAAIDKDKGSLTEFILGGKIR